MTRKGPSDAYLDRLRGWRNRPDFDYSMAFLQKQFKRDVEKPYKQLIAIAELWPRLVPAALVEKTKLESVSRGVLKVTCESSGVLYELDRLLRQGLQRELITQNRGPAIQRVQLRVGPIDAASPRREGRR